MGLFKRLVVAMEKIASHEPISAKQIQEILQTSLKHQMLVEEHAKKLKIQESYNWLKERQQAGTELSDKEKHDLDWCENLVKLGKLNEYKPQP